MKTTIDLFAVADTIADVIERGIVINVNGENPSHITALDPQEGLTVDLVFRPGHTRHLSITRLPAELYSPNRSLDPNPPILHPELPVAQGVAPKPAPAAKPAARKSGDIPSLEQLEGKSVKSKWYMRYNVEKNLARITIAHFLMRDAQLMRVSSTAFAERMSDIFGYRLSTARHHVSRAVKMGILKRQRFAGTNWIELMILKPEQESTPPRDSRLDEEKPAHEAAIDKAVDETVLP